MRNINTILYKFFSNESVTITPFYNISGKYIENRHSIVEVGLQKYFMRRFSKSKKIKSKEYN
jgi:hypothetical protein